MLELIDIPKERLKIELASNIFPQHDGCVEKALELLINASGV